MGELQDLIRQFRLGQPSCDYLIGRVIDKVLNRHPRSIGRSSKAAHLFLIERIEWKSSEAQLHNFPVAFHLVFPFVIPFSSCCSPKASRNASFTDKGIRGCSNEVNVTVLALFANRTLGQ
jgi:hypothetical protein